MLMHANIPSWSHFMPDAAVQPRPYVSMEANYRQLLDYQPNVAILPWGATEAHNYHLPHGTDVIEATEVAIRAAEMAHRQDARPIVLPTIPFGNNEQQLDYVKQVAEALCQLLVGLSSAEIGQLPYLERSTASRSEH